MSTSQFHRFFTDVLLAWFSLDERQRSAILLYTSFAVQQNVHIIYLLARFCCGNNKPSDLCERSRTQCVLL